MLTCIILCKGFSRGYAKLPNPGSRAHRLFQTLPSGSYSLHRLSAILASKDFFTVMASSGHIS